MMVEQIFSARSTNGRWGLALVGPEGTKLPCEGSLEYLGKVAGIATYQITPGDTGAWIMTSAEVTVHGGATVVESIGLQSGRVVSLLLLGQEAVVEHYGYKRRSSRIAAYIRGEERSIPGPVLLAMGLVQPEPEPEPEPVAQPEPLQGAMAAAFAALRR